MPRENPAVYTVKPYDGKYRDIELREHPEQKPSWSFIPRERYRHLSTVATCSYEAMQAARRTPIKGGPFTVRRLIPWLFSELTVAVAGYVAYWTWWHATLHPILLSQ